MKTLDFPNETCVCVCVFRLMGIGWLVGWVGGRLDGWIDEWFEWNGVFCSKRINLHYIYSRRSCIQFDVKNECTQQHIHMQHIHTHTHTPLTLHLSHTFTTNTTQIFRFVCLLLLRLLSFVSITFSSASISLFFRLLALNCCVCVYVIFNSSIY